MNQVKMEGQSIQLIIYGCGADYLNRKQLLQFEVYKGNVECIAAASRDHYADMIDGMPLIQPDEVSRLQFDYCLVFSDLYFEDIQRKLIISGIDSDKILNSRILSVPGFDFMRYHSLLRDPVTIVSCDCFAAQVYAYLGLRFSSPFILMKTVTNDEYIRLLENFQYYMEQDFNVERQEQLDRAKWGIAALGNGESRVRFELFHYSSFQAAKECWERRKKRINSNRVLFTGYVFSDTEAERVRNIRAYGKCFFSVSRKKEGDGIYYLPRFRWRIEHQCDVFGYGLGDYVRNMEQLSHSMDILKMLCGENDFINEVTLQNEYQSER